MQTRGSTNKSPIKLIMQQKINWHVICLRMGKTNATKTPPGDFKVTTLEISLLSQQAVTSKWIPIPYTNLQLNLYPNTQLDFFSSDNFSFWCTTPNTWLTNCADFSTWLQSLTREGCWLQSFSVHPNNKDLEDAWLQNITVHKHSNFFIRTINYGKIVSSVTICLNKLCSTLVQLMKTLIALKIILLYV